MDYHDIAVTMLDESVSNSDLFRKLRAFRDEYGSEALDMLTAEMDGILS